MDCARGNVAEQQRLPVLAQLSELTLLEALNPVSANHFARAKWYRDPKHTRAYPGSKPGGSPIAVDSTMGHLPGLSKEPPRHRAKLCPHARTSTWHAPLGSLRHPPPQSPKQRHTATWECAASLAESGFRFGLPTPASDLRSNPSSCESHEVRSDTKPRSTT